MYRVMIVDDEKPGREILKYLIDWDKTNFIISATAKNGKDALEQYNNSQPDLIITDIQMPVMDGLELINQIKAKNPKQEFIVISCFEDFTYAQQAIRMGVCDYLIKGVISEENLYTLLSKVENKLRETTTALAISSTSHLEITTKDIDSLEKLFFETLTLNEIQNILKNNQLDLCAECYVVVCVCIDQYMHLINNNKLKQTEIRTINRIIQATINTCNDGVCIYAGNDKFIAIVAVTNSVSQMKFVNDCNEFSKRIRYEINKLISHSFTITVSNRFYNLTQIYKKTKEAIDLIAFRIYAGYNKTILHNTFCQDLKKTNPQKIQTQLNQIKETLNNKNFDKINSQLHTLFKEDIHGFSQLNYSNYIHSFLLEIIILFANKNNLTNNQVFGINYIPLDTINTFKTINETIEWYSSLIQNIRAQCDNCPKAHINNIVVKNAVTFIDNQSSVSALSLDSIATFVNVHKVYLCRVFKKELSMTVGEYIMLKKVETAKRLLVNTSLKIYEVSNSSGFSTSSRFNTVFKNTVGITPKEYRKSI